MMAGWVLWHAPIRRAKAASSDRWGGCSQSVNRFSLFLVQYAVALTKSYEKHSWQRVNFNNIRKHQ
jgi:hypothetical protein